MDSRSVLFYRLNDALAKMELEGKITEDELNYVMENARGMDQSELKKLCYQYDISDELYYDDDDENGPDQEIWDTM